MEKTVEKIAILKKYGENYSVFQAGDLLIKFYTSPYLEKYCKINVWKNHGYIVCTAKFSTVDELVEDSIDLESIAERLHLPQNVFKNITEVRTE